MTFFLLLLMVFAVLSLLTDKLITAFVYLSVFSLLCSICYLLYQAPDVAIAEAVIGSTIATVLYLVALKKYKIFRVYYTSKVKYIKKFSWMADERSRLEAALQKFAKEKELEVDMIFTTDTLEQIQLHYSYDLIIESEDETIRINGEKSNYHYDEIIEYLNKNFKTIKSVRYACLTSSEGDGT